MGRIVDLLWRNYGTSADAVRIQHGYDRANNRIYREDPVAAANGAYLDEFYTYDAVNQLTNRDRGQLNAAKDAISGTAAKEEDWTLDPTGNWTGYVQKTSGSTDLSQARTHDAANEITEIDSAATHVASDRAGNMTKLPQPGDWTSHYCTTYDAWNRRRKLRKTGRGGRSNAAQSSAFHVC